MKKDFQNKRGFSVVPGASGMGMPAAQATPSYEDRYANWNSTGTPSLAGETAEERQARIREAKGGGGSGPSFDSVARLVTELARLGVQIGTSVRQGDVALEEARIRAAALTQANQLAASGLPTDATRAQQILALLSAQNMQPQMNWTAIAVGGILIIAAAGGIYYLSTQPKRNPVMIRSGVRKWVNSGKEEKRARANGWRKVKK